MGEKKASRGVPLKSTNLCQNRYPKIGWQALPSCFCHSFTLSSPILRYIWDISIANVYVQPLPHLHPAKEVFQIRTRVITSLNYLFNPIIYECVCVFIFRMFSQLLSSCLKLFVYVFFFFYKIYTKPGFRFFILHSLIIASCIVYCSVYKCFEVTVVYLSPNVDVYLHYIIS